MRCSPISGGFQSRALCRPRTLRRLIILIALIAALAPAGIAQHGFPTSAPARSRSAIHRSSSTTRFSEARRNRNSLPFSFFGDSFDFDNLYSSGYPVASDPPPFLLQAVRAMGGPADSIGRAENYPEPPSSQPLMIELQNGRYVRVKDAAIDGEAVPLNFRSQNAGWQNPVSQNPAPPPAAAKASQPALSIAAGTHTPDLPPAVLIFHDGRSQEVRDYTIADGILYARGDLYTDGYWNKKIDLAALDLPQTLQANASRNVRFVLPSSPNEVITRP